VHRIPGDIPLITGKLEFVLPELAYEYLEKNISNRPVPWGEVEKYAQAIMADRWEPHGQGIMFDVDGNLITGQTRLWAIIYAGKGAWLHTSRGNPRSAARLVDRGRPQSARDLASRSTRRRHSPTEASLARGILAIGGNLRPSVDELSAVIELNASAASAVLSVTRGARKPRAVLMILAAICEGAMAEQIPQLARRVDILADELEESLRPQSAAKCWGRGAAFALAMGQSKRIVQVAIKELQKP